MLDKKHISEKLVLSCLIQLGFDESNLEDLKEYTKQLNTDLFIYHKHSKIFAEVNKSIESGQTVDLLDLDNKFPESGITNLTAFVDLTSFASTAHLNHYIKSLIVEYKKHEFKKLGEALVSDKETSEDKLALMEFSKDKFIIGEEVMAIKPVIDLYDKCTQITEKHPCSYQQLDTILGGGFERKRLYTIAARTGCGKSTMLLNLAHNFAQNNLKAVFLTLEMPEEHTVRSFAIRLTYKTNTKNDIELMNEAKTNPSYQAINQNLSITELGNNIESIKQLCSDFDVVLIDQLSFMRTNKKTETRSQEVSTIVHDLKEYAVKHNKIVLLAAQINREGANHKGETPQLHHLKESGGVEESSDVVLLMHIDSDKPDILNVNVAKNRTGEKKMLHMKANFAKAKIDEIQNYNEEKQEPDEYDILNDKDFL
jgi:replicative DNA helicase